VCLGGNLAPGVTSIDVQADTVVTTNSNGYRIGTVQQPTSDLSGDGVPDLLVRDGQYDLLLFSGSAIALGGSLFSEVDALLEGSHQGFVAAGDLDGDGLPEVIRMSGTAATVTMGSEILAAIADPNTDQIPVQATGLAVSTPYFKDVAVGGDFDGDGVGDIAIADQGDVVIITASP